jgi:hypothetical protein
MIPLYFCSIILNVKKPGVVDHHVKRPVLKNIVTKYKGKSISKLQMDIELKQIRVLI